MGRTKHKYVKKLVLTDTCLNTYTEHNISAFSALRQTHSKAPGVYGGPLLKLTVSITLRDGSLRQCASFGMGQFPFIKFRKFKEANEWANKIIKKGGYGWMLKTSNS